LVDDNIGKYFSEVQIEENMAALPLDEIEPMEGEPTEVDFDCPNLTKDVLIAKINADSAERVARIHAESAEKIARINSSEKHCTKDWGVHSDGYQGGF
jgi:hypothetical protein